MVSTASAKILHNDRRSLEREPMDREAVLRLDEQLFPIEIKDLTRDGCKIRTNQELAAGRVVTLGLPGVGRVAVQIIWRSAEGYGCAFLERLRPGAVTAVARNNVVSMGDPLAEGGFVTADEVKWTPRTRVAVLLAITSLLWLALGALAWALLR